jgi:hypothetical protein
LTGRFRNISYKHILVMVYLHSVIQLVRNDELRGILIGFIHGNEVYQDIIGIRIVSVSRDNLQSAGVFLPLVILEPRRPVFASVRYEHFIIPSLFFVVQLYCYCRQIHWWLSGDSNAVSIVLITSIILPEDFWELDFEIRLFRISFYR